MAFHIRDEETDTLVRELARKEKVGLKDAVKAAVKERLKMLEAQPSLHERLSEIAKEILGVILVLGQSVRPQAVGSRRQLALGHERIQALRLLDHRPQHVERGHVPRALPDRVQRGVAIEQRHS